MKNNQEENSDVHIVINLGIHKTSVLSWLDFLRVGKAKASKEKTRSASSNNAVSSRSSQSMGKGFSLT